MLHSIINLVFVDFIKIEFGWFLCRLHSQVLQMFQTKDWYIQVDPTTCHLDSHHCCSWNAPFLRVTNLEFLWLWEPSALFLVCLGTSLSCTCALRADVLRKACCKLWLSLSFRSYSSHQVNVETIDVFTRKIIRWTRKFFWRYNIALWCWSVKGRHLSFGVKIFLLLIVCVKRDLSWFRIDKKLTINLASHVCTLDTRECEI